VLGVFGVLSVFGGGCIRVNTLNVINYHLD